MPFQPSFRLAATSTVALGILTTLLTTGCGQRGTAVAAGNFKALFESIEREQALRGNL